MKSIKEYWTPRVRKIVLIAGGIVVGLFLTALIYGLSIRKSILDKAVARVTATLKDEYGVDFSVKNYGFAGLTTVRFQGVAVKPDSAERLSAIKDLKISVKLFPLLSKNIVIDDVELDSAIFTLVKKESASNYDFIFKKKGEVDSSSQPTDRNLAQLADRIIKQAFAKIPANMSLRDVELSYQDSASFQKIRVPDGNMRSGRYDVDVFLNEDDAKWNLSGRIDRDDQQVKLTIASDNQKVPLPFLRRKFGLGVYFDEMTFDLKEIKRSGKESLQLTGDFEVKKMAVNHRRFSDQDIDLPDATVSGKILISEDALEILEGTSVKVNNFIFRPHLKYFNKPTKQLEFDVRTDRFPAQDFFDAIPKGLFHTLEGIEVGGDIAYALDFKVDFSNPDSLQFNSRIDDKDLVVKKWGNADMPLLNKEFVHEVYEDTVKVRDIVVGPSNPDYVPLDQIAPILKRTVLNTEDPFFYKHLGFEEEAFKLSIVTNIKEKAFKRGASTISMQLIKNLYLNRNKTLMRKFEEIILVWLMERTHVLSKDRLLEIYFNIIEWGKGVYGISEGSKYYFGKKPSELTLGESLFLSSIVPRPKTGLASFDYTGHLKPWVRKHFNTYGYILNRLGQLNDVDVPEGYGFYTVVLQPNLRPPRPKGVVDSVPSIDSLHLMIEEIDTEESQRRSLIERLFGKDRAASDTVRNQ